MSACWSPASPPGGSPTGRRQWSACEHRPGERLQALWRRRRPRDRGRDHQRPLVAGIGDMEDELFTLNDTGKAIWDQLDGRRSLADVVTAIETEFEGAENGAIERDVLGLVAELVQRRMLVTA